jgi:hypothetical protein
MIKHMLFERYPASYTRAKAKKAAKAKGKQAMEA